MHVIKEAEEVEANHGTRWWADQRRRTSNEGPR